MKLNVIDDGNLDEGLTCPAKFVPVKFEISVDWYIEKNADL